MGYRSDFTISADVPLKPFTARLSAISGYTMSADMGDIFLTDCKWYECVEDMRKISAEHPTVKFTVHQNGEDGEQIMIYALGGAAILCSSEVIFEPNTLWEPAA